jgi:hypothetical protein
LWPIAGCRGVRAGPTPSSGSPLPGRPTRPSRSGPGPTASTRTGAARPWRPVGRWRCPPGSLNLRGRRSGPWHSRSPDGPVPCPLRFAIPRARSRSARAGRAPGRERGGRRPAAGNRRGRAQAPGEARRATMRGGREPVPPVAVDAERSAAPPAQRRGPARRHGGGAARAHSGKARGGTERRGLREPRGVPPLRGQRGDHGSDHRGGTRGIGHGRSERTLPF